MTPQELDIALRRHTEHEDMYLQGWTNPIILDDLEEIELNGKCFRVLRLPQKIGPISCGKHSRFNLYPVHIHPWVEFNYMYSGSCIQHVNGKPVRLCQGQTLLLDQNTVHELPVLGEDDILLNIYIQRSYLDAGFFNRISQKNIVSQFFVNAITEGVAHDSFLFFPSERSRRLPLFIQELFCECLDPTAFSQDTLSSLFTLIITELIQCYGEAEQPAGISSGRDASVLPVLRYIEQNYRTASLQQTAAHFNLNPNYLSGLLKTRTGSSFNALVCRQRMAVAKNLLLYSQKSVTEIAGDVGYENTTFFYKKFREYVGGTPAEYREKNGYR